MATNKDSKKPLAKLSKRIGHEDLKFGIPEDGSKQTKNRFIYFEGTTINVLNQILLLLNFPKNQFEIFQLRKYSYIRSTK